MSLLKDLFLNMKNNHKKECNSLENEFIFLKTKFQNYTNLVIEILLYKLKISKDNKFNQKILELILTDNSILIKSK